jgi:hypothetical protein
MSGIKRLMELQEKQRDVAVQIAIEASVLKCCEYHGVVYDPGGGDKQSAFRLANYKFTHGKVSVFHDRREMTDTIDEVISDAAMDCWQCEKILED